MEAKTKFNREDLLIKDDYYNYVDGGDYVECCLCQARGWRDEIVHEKDCLLADDAVESVSMTANLDPAKLCSKSQPVGE